MNDAAALIRTRLNGDLISAMKSRDAIAVAILRCLFGAIDNASAVALTSEHVVVYGRSGDVPRKDLSEAECNHILDTEFHSRRTAATEYERLGRHEQAARLQAESAVIARYLESI